MPNPQDDSFDTDDALSRLMRNGASPRELFYGLTAQGVPPQQAMTAAYARDSDVVRAALQAYGRPTAIPNAPLSPLNEGPVVDTRLPPADLSRGRVVQPMSARGASVFPDPPQFPPLTSDDAMRRRPGFIPRPDRGENLAPGYLDPRSEAERRSRWAARDSSRESLGLPQDSTEQFAGVNLARNADGGYGLEPHYAAQTQRALETEPYVPSQRERIVRGGKFYAGAAPFGFAGPGSLNFDPSLEANTDTLAPFRRPFAERGPLDIAADAAAEAYKRLNQKFVESPAYQASLQPEAADHGYAERRKQSAVENAINPIRSYPETYLRMNREAQDQFWRGAGQVTNWQDPWAVAKGATDIGLGASSYFMSPINAAVRSIISQPVEDVVGLPRQIPEGMAQGALSAVGGVGRLIARLLSR